MPLLGDFLGHVMAEITIARMQADLEALRVADLYASHPLLRTLPVPRFRLRDADIEIPVVVDKVEEADVEQSPRGGVNKEELNKSFVKALSAQLWNHRIRADKKLLSKLRYAVKQCIESLEYPTEISVDASRFANELTSTVTTVLLKNKKDLDRQKLQDFNDDLRDNARLEILKLRTLPPRLHVLVTTREIKEAGPTELLGRLVLKIHEENLEWALLDRDGESFERLIPE